MRINKFLAQKNICSRRKVDELIELGLIEVNGQKAQLGQKLEIGDEVFLTKEKKTLVYEENTEHKLFYIAMNKPKGISCTCLEKDPSNIITFLHQEINKEIEKQSPDSEPLKQLLETRVYPVGRLDKDSEGLIILTNDGELTNQLMHPSYEHEKEYEVTLQQKINQKLIDAFKNGLEINIADKGEKEAIKKAAPVQKCEQINEYKLKLVLVQGINRQIRRTAQAVENRVTHLIRSRLNRLNIKDLKGKVFTLVDKKDLL